MNDKSNRSTGLRIKTYLWVICRKYKMSALTMGSVCTVHHSVAEWQRKSSRKKGKPESHDQRCNGVIIYDYHTVNSRTWKKSGDQKGGKLTTWSSIILSDYTCSPPTDYSYTITILLLTILLLLNMFYNLWIIKTTQL